MELFLSHKIFFYFMFNIKKISTVITLTQTQTTYEGKDCVIDSPNPNEDLNINDEKHNNFNGLCQELTSNLNEYVDCIKVLNLEKKQLDEFYDHKLHCSQIKNLFTKISLQYQVVNTYNQKIAKSTLELFIFNIKNYFAANLPPNRCIVEFIKELEKWTSSLYLIYDYDCNIIENQLISINIHFSKLNSEKKISKIINFFKFKVIWNFFRNLF